VYRFLVVGGALLAAPLAAVAAQQPVAADSIHQHGDSLPRPVELPAVTVTAAPVRREDPSSSVSVPATILQRTPALNPYDLVRQTAGVEVHDQGQGPGFASDVSVRGFSSDHSTDVALWIDGVPINEPVNGHSEGYSDWSLLFPQAVQSIDFFKGPTSAVSGNFALAGAVNIRTLERMNGTSAWLSGGMYGRGEGTVLTGFDRPGTGGVFGLRGLHESGWRPNSDYTLGQGHARVVRDLSSTTSVDAGVELFATGWNSPGFLTREQFDARDYDVVADPTDGGFKRRAQERVSIRITPSGSPLVWRSTVYATQGRWQLFLTVPPEGGEGEGSGSQTEEEHRRYGFGATSALTWSLPRAQITLGGEGRWDHADYQNYFTTARSRDSAQTLTVSRQASAALFAQSVTDLGHHVRVSIGGRLDHLDTRTTPDGNAALSDAKTIASPKVGVLYHLKRVGDVYANVSRGFRQADGVIEDPTLPLITAWAYETGLKIDARQLNAGIAFFRMDVSNEQPFDPITLQATDNGASRRQGIEAELRAKIGPGVSLSADATLNDAKYRRFLTEEGDTLFDVRVYNTAKYVGSAAVDVAPSGTRWHLRLATNVVGPYSPFDQPGVTLPAYALFHASVGTWVGPAQLEVGVRNLLNRAYPELQAGDFVAPGQPRSLVGSVRYIF
jgi:outer membrane receptor protein involved in Fe transport